MKQFAHRLGLFCLTAGCMASLCSLSSNAQDLNIEKVTPNVLVNKQVPQRKSTDAILIAPQHFKMYQFIDNDWKLSVEKTKKYDDRLNVTEYYEASYTLNGEIESEDSVYTTHNEQDLTTSMTMYMERDENNQWQKITRVTYDYDNSFIMPYQTINYYWDSTTSEFLIDKDHYSSYYAEVERDGSDRITSNIFWKDNSKAQLLNKFYYDYSGDNTVKSVVKEIYRDDNVFDYKSRYSEIEWAKTNNKILANKDYFNAPMEITDKDNNVVSHYREEVDFGYGWNQINERTIYYDEKGRLTFDNTTSNYTQTIYIYEYNDTQNTVTYERTVIGDFNNDGEITSDEEQVERTISYFDPETGYLIKNESFVKENGELINTIRESFEYTFDENNNLTVMIDTVEDVMSGVILVKNKFEYSDFFEANATDIDNAEKANYNVTLMDNKLIFNRISGKTYNVYNLEGKLVKSGVISPVVSLEDLPNGMYILNYNNGKNTLKFNKR